jgi:hypothetical protein
MTHDGGLPSYEAMCKWWEQQSKPEPATHVHTRLITMPLRILLGAHGCIITSTSPTENTVAYSPGTTRTFLYPVTTDMRYRVLLPDHIELLEAVRRHGIKEPVSLSLVLNKQSIPELEKMLANTNNWSRELRDLEAELKRIR